MSQRYTLHIGQWRETEVLKTPIFISYKIERFSNIWKEWRNPQRIISIDYQASHGSALSLLITIPLLHYQTSQGSALSLTNTITLLHYQASQGSALSLTITIPLLHYQASQGSALSLTITLPLLHYQASQGSALSLIVTWQCHTAFPALKLDIYN